MNQTQSLPSWSLPTDYNICPKIILFYFILKMGIIWPHGRIALRI